MLQVSAVKIDGCASMAVHIINGHIGSDCSSTVDLAYLTIMSHKASAVYANGKGIKLRIAESHFAENHAVYITP